MNAKDHDSSPAPARRESTEGSEAPLEIDTRQLLGGQRELTIIHAGERYRLRITSTNKLILTK